MVRFGCICESEFTVKTDSKAHQGKHTDNLKFECKQCGKNFKTKKGLHMHMKKHDDSKIVCAECGKQFKNEKGFDIHMKVHVGKTDQQNYHRKKRNITELFQCHIFQWLRTKKTNEHLFTPLSLLCPSQCNCYYVRQS